MHSLKKLFLPLYSARPPRLGFRTTVGTLK
jgi:hypothetical protein